MQLAGGLVAYVLIRLLYPDSAALASDLADSPTAAGQSVKEFSP